MGFLAAIAGAVVTTLVCLNAQRVGVAFGVLAEPDSERRLHCRPTPQVGGIAILSGLLLCCAITYFGHPFADTRLIAAIALCAIGIGAVGFADDQTGVSPIARIVMVFVFMGVAVLVDRELVASTLNWGSFQPTTIPLFVYLPLLSLASGGIVNAVNMADGQDGVVGSMFVVWAVCLILTTTGVSQALAVMLCVSSGIFLAFNLWGKLFLGDCGSYGVTFTLGLLVALAHARGQITIETVMVMFFIPVADCLRLLINRPMRGVSPFLGDRDHFHHRLELKMGKQRGLACYFAAVATSSLIATLAPRFALVAMCFLSAFYFSFAWLTEPQAMGEGAKNADDAQESNVVPLARTIGSHDRQQGAA